MRFVLVLSVMLLLPAQVLAIQHHLLVITGIGGTAAYEKQFADNASGLMQSAQDLGIDRSNIIRLGDSRPADRQSIQQALHEISLKAAADDRVFVVLIGHGNGRGDNAVFNLSGPDISAEELEQALSMLEQRSVIIINSASASGPFIRALSDKNRLVITATSSAREYYAPVFGNYFFSAFGQPGADRDKDEKISMLEAFDYARLEIRRAFDIEKRLLTEHALLDDNGDGRGSREPVRQGGDDVDGVLASQIHLQPPLSLASGASPVLIEMLQQKQQLEQSISELKLKRENLENDDYYRQLEGLLVELALLARQIRAKTG
ncbi:MAG: hypothetical protein HKN34_11455 [Gammaproteobacteria bacterium]|nr:hypothetical protein [Gammaproteobacteria bacterium]